MCTVPWSGQSEGSGIAPTLTTEAKRQLQLELPLFSSARELDFSHNSKMAAAVSHFEFILMFTLVSLLIKEGSLYTNLDF